MKIHLSHWTLVVVSALGFALSCSKQKQSAASGSYQLDSRRTRTEITLESLQSSSGCLNVERLATAYRELNPDLNLLEVTTRFSMPHGGNLRNEFRLLTAFGNFKYESRPGFERVDLQGIRQTNCRTLSLERADGTTEEMRIVKFGSDFISAESREGNRREYRWLSSQRVLLNVRYRAHDLPCTEKTAYVDTTQVLDWGPGLPDIVDDRSPLYVDDSYLAQLASATGRNVEDFYREIPGEAGSPSRRVQVSDRLVELAKSTVRQELISCNRAAPPEPRPPEVRPDPAPPGPAPAPEPEPDPEPDPPFDPDDPISPDPVPVYDGGEDWFDGAVESFQ